MDALAPIGIGIMNTGADVHWSRPIEFDNPDPVAVGWSRQWGKGKGGGAFYHSFGAPPPPQPLTELEFSFSLGSDRRRDPAETGERGEAIGALRQEGMLWKKEEAQFLAGGS